MIEVLDTGSKYFISAEYKILSEGYVLDIDPSTVSGIVDRVISHLN